MGNSTSPKKSRKDKFKVPGGEALALSEGEEVVEAQAHLR